MDLCAAAMKLCHGTGRAADQEVAAEQELKACLHRVLCPPHAVDSIAHKDVAVRLQVRSAQPARAALESAGIEGSRDRVLEGAGIECVAMTVKGYDHLLEPYRLDGRLGVL